MSETKPNRMAPDVQREYRTEQIAVSWETALCIHAAECIRGLPQVFNTRRRPWVDASAAAADEIAAVVQRCPTSALRYARLDGGPDEQPSEPARIAAQPDGPLYVRGQVELVDQDGSRRLLTRAALCRCGESKNKPFRDNSHLEAGFDDTGTVGEGGAGLSAVGGTLTIKPLPAGPLLCNGNLTLRAAAWRLRRRACVAWLFLAVGELTRPAVLGLVYW